MAPSSFAHQLAVSSTLPRLSVGMNEPIILGFLAPLSGSLESWGQPGLYGCEIWVDWLNRNGGLMIGGRRYPVEIKHHDCGPDAEAAMAGAQELVERHGIKLLMMLGGDALTPLRDYLNRRKILTATLLPSDLSPESPYLIAPSELHPIFNVTGVEWLRKSRPELGRVALCSQMDGLGLPSLASYRAAFRAAGLPIVKEIRYAPDSRDVAGVVQPMLDADPDILCWCTSHTPMVHAMTEYAHAQGFKGQIISCTLDRYDRLIERTSPAFMEGVIFQFPEFDDPKLRGKTFFFHQPGAFFEEYNRRFPGAWSAVSWEYAAILDIWHGAVEKANSLSSASVLAAMKQLGHVTHAFGPARWWGRELFGIDNALVGDWPVVTIQQGRARIAEFRSISTWLSRHGALLKEEMQDLGQLWEQRMLAESRTPADVL
ncbi:ABC transporter substrate-binding protein [Aquibaculum arenosum]|uniref:ABC transporter substrate-binding protein n=1 Tax=Aquibaculum arenosum TaxID=3032591 RepID=A0ABT5YLX3_9PROT|nr:ABC transporter substrate-binding protein [Fodinicurvata sp. CAU 1616]MDF2095946.1 ABC transporter substrate-binding protein [Fodinicurvata sp. CAU 1616]